MEEGIGETGTGEMKSKPRNRKAEAERRAAKGNGEQVTARFEGKPPRAPQSPLNDELKVIRRVARALEGLTPQQKGRVLFYIQHSVDQERMALDPLGPVRP